MNVLDQLERSLSQAVDAGAARGLTPSTTSRRRRLPRALQLPLAVLAVGGLTTGALAATGNLPILKVGDRKSDPNYMQLRMPGFASSAKGPVRLLPLRARDPQGGPPWALRQFSIGRGQVCLQAGQLYRGRFGVVTQIVDRRPGDTASGPARARTVFQDLAPATLSDHTSCGRPHMRGEVIASGASNLTFTPEGSDLRSCQSPPPLTSAPCVVTSATALQFGAVGPRARAATFIHPGGRRGPTHTIDAPGGYYLFAESVDTTPFRALPELERSIRQRFQRRYPDVFRIAPGRRAKTVPLERVRAFRRYEERVLRVTQQRRRSYWRAQWGSSVRVAFDGAPSVQLAGPGGDPRVYVKPLPGVSPVVSEIPRVGTAQVTSTLPGRDRAVEVRFRSPAALDERPGSYDVTVRGPRAGSCSQTVSSLAQYAHETAKGAPLVVRVRPSFGAAKGKPPGWCRGARYGVRVRYVVRDISRPGYRSEQLVGTTSFVAR